MSKFDKFKMTVEFEVTEPQALALQAMFEHWTHLGNIGSTRVIGFFIDGCGDFQPNCKINFSKQIHALTDEMRTKAIIRNTSGNEVYDFDIISYILDYNEFMDDLEFEYGLPTNKCE